MNKNRSLPIGLRKNSQERIWVIDVLKKGLLR
jgi:hypothetical protein